MEINVSNISKCFKIIVLLMWEESDRLGKLQRSGVQPSERLASLIIIGSRLKVPPETPRTSQSIMVQRGLRDALNHGPQTKVYLFRRSLPQTNLNSSSAAQFGMRGRQMLTWILIANSKKTKTVYLYSPTSCTIQIFFLHWYQEFPYSLFCMRYLNNSM